MILLSREIRYAARRWSRSPGLAAVVALSLALGLGANAAIFGVLRGVVLAPYDLPELDRLVAVTRQNPAQGRSGWPLPPQEFRDWRAVATSFAGMAAHQPSSTTLTADGEALRLTKSNITANFFEVLGRPVALGRAPSEAETVPDGPEVVVLGHALWRTRFGGDAGIVGRTITLDGTETEVIGVADERFAYPENADLWTPLQLGDELARSRTFHTLHTVARLADGVSVEAARTELTGITERLEQAHPDTNEGERAGVQRLAAAGLGNVARGLAAVFLGAGMVLLLTALNVAILFIARSLEGSRETAIRAALGASRKEVLAPVVADALLLAASALTLGVPVAAGLLAAVRNGVGGVLPHAGRIGLDGATVVLVVALTAIASLACSAVPALRAFRAGTDALGRGRMLARPGSAHARRALIATEMTLALVTLVGAGLLLRTFAAYSAVDRGMDDGEGIVFTVSLPGGQYPAGSESVRTLFSTLYERIGALPGVKAAGGSAWLPWMGSVAQLNYTLEGMDPVGEAERPVAYYQTVGGDFFGATGIAVLEGRGFDAGDRDGTRRVAVVTPAFVRAHGLEGRAVGATVSIEIGDEEQWEKTIVGVVEDVPLRGLDQAHPPAMYTPLAQTPWNTQEIVVRTTVPGETVLPAIRGVLAELDPGLPAYGVTTLPELLAASTARPRVQMQLLSAFAVLAVLLAVVGAHGVLSFVVAARRREIGVRMAVGATRADVRGLILKEGLSGVAVGALLGLTLALAGARLLGGVLFGVRPDDPLVLGASAGVILLAGLAASLAPSWRAARVEPRTALAQGE